ncbi:MAG: Rpn family recombination-promoting nuclease/putative transposase [Candidatus Sericytochromatia bacterium]
MQERYLNPFTDFGFKKLFGEEANKDLLIDFLNSLLYEKHKQKIKDLTFRKTEHLGSTELDRKAVFDLYCEDEIGQKFIVELQKAEQRFFKDRTIYYSTFAIQEQAKRGDWSYELSPVYCISILDFIFNKEEINKDKYLSYTRLMDEETKEVFYDKLLYVYIEIPKFSKTEKDLTNNIDKWLYFLKYLSKLDEIPSPLHTEMFIKAFEIAEITNFTQEQRLAYEDSIKYYRDLKNVLDKSFDDGKQIGKIEGEIIGILKTQKETVLNMNKLGMSLEIISQVTSLSIKKITEILRE